jgi:hypothetical protein
LTIKELNVPNDMDFLGFMSILFLALWFLSKERPGQAMKHFYSFYRNCNIVAVVITGPDSLVLLSPIQLK